MADVYHQRRHSVKMPLSVPASIIARLTPRKRAVSPPFSPCLRHSRVPSHSSGTENAVLTTSEMEERATALTKALLTDQGWESAARYLTTELTKRLESPSSREKHLVSGTGPTTSAKSKGRSSRDAEACFTLKDAAVDETQRKVWVVAERARRENRATQWVEMMSFDDEGKVCEIEGWGRPVRLDAD